MDLVTVRNRRMLFQRFGTLNPVRQRRDSPAPTARGFWAFPFPYFDWFYASHQIERLLPKPLRHDRGFDPDAIVTPDEDRDTWTREQWSEHWDARKRWMDEHSRLLQVTKFWHPGPVFAHLDERGRYLGWEWHELSIGQLSKAIRRQVASAVPGRRVSGRWPDRDGNPGALQLYCRSDDHAFEVFIPSSARAPRRTRS